MINAKEMIKKIDESIKKDFTIVESVKVDSTNSTLSFTFSSSDELVKSEKLLKSLSYDANLTFSHNGDKELDISVLNPGGFKVAVARKMIKALNDNFGYEIALPSGF